MYQSIITEVDASVGIITLNKADRHNAFDDLLVAELISALADLAADPGVRAVVLSAAGKSFCAGTDLDALARAASHTQQEHEREAGNLAQLLSTLNEFGKPTIARVQGPAYGPGVGLIAACDIAVATYDALFALTEVRLGMMPAVVSPYVVAAIGERHCRRYMLSGERFSASEAYRIGLVHEIVAEGEQLDEAVGEIVDNLLKGGPDAQAGCKMLLHAIVGQPIDASTVDETVQRVANLRISPEGVEGLAAFLEKRKPNWIA